MAGQIEAPSAAWCGEQLDLARKRVDAAIGGLRKLDRLTSTEVRALNVHVDDLLTEAGRLQGAVERLMQRTAQGAMRPQG